MKLLKIALFHVVAVALVLTNVAGGAEGDETEAKRKQALENSGKATLGMLHLILENGEEVDPEKLPPITKLKAAAFFAVIKLNEKALNVEAMRPFIEVIEKQLGEVEEAVKKAPQMTTALEKRVEQFYYAFDKVDETASEQLKARKKKLESAVGDLIAKTPGYVSISKSFRESEDDKAEAWKLFRVAQYADVVVRAKKLKTDVEAAEAVTPAQALNHYFLRQQIEMLTSRFIEDNQFAAEDATAFAFDAIKAKIKAEKK